MKVTEHNLTRSAFQLNTTKTTFTTSGLPHPQWSKQYNAQFSILGTTHESLTQAADNGTLGLDAQ
eukprot:4496016-Prorocentrum_lima.AAC.1